MEPTTPRRDRTTWKHWAAALTVPFAITIGAPAIASLPLPIAYTIAGIIAVALTALYVRLGGR